MAALDREVEQHGRQREQHQVRRRGRGQQQRGRAQGDGRPAHGRPEAAVAQPPGRRRGPLMRSLIADAQSQDEIATALRDQWLRPRRAVAADLLRQGIAAGEFRADLDVEVTLDLLFAPVYYRLLLGHETLSPQFAVTSTRHLIMGLKA